MSKILIADFNGDTVEVVPERTGQFRVRVRELQFGKASAMLTFKQLKELHDEIGRMISREYNRTGS